MAKPAALARLVRSRVPDVIDAAGWRAIDAAEIARGRAQGRPRVTFTARMGRRGCVQRANPGAGTI